MRSEVERLCEVGVLRKVNRSEWAAPTYYQEEEWIRTIHL
jgi:hypothetical protein